MPKACNSLSPDLFSGLGLTMDGRDSSPTSDGATTGARSVGSMDISDVVSLRCVDCDGVARACRMFSM